jgi:hypothetical protein
MNSVEIKVGLVKQKIDPVGYSFINNLSADMDEIIYGLLRSFGKLLHLHESLKVRLK